ncbi:RHS repeat-associated core domain-containing protein [Ralstonia pseudosolanacearum]|uniref:RHS repeat domain-containing protein n=1 Tax=Ralstonia pseudosolanacearum TaxID=1310165 RepID=UPI0026753438|nr:RHS repeat domain-containing protein [Ralstonia pseudosolanacearum]MDO3527585.1 RHS repeat domain-containing protein [Ralstonia pseudosolanacearum]MDO3534334.1 RHS repeat domain-containing protein [Ralstonia pseudosolanacearum]
MGVKRFIEKQRWAAALSTGAEREPGLTGRHTPLYRAVSAAALLTLSAQTLAQTQVSTTQYAYDTVGNLTQITDPRGLVTTLTYDALGRRTKVQGPPATPGGAVPTVVFNYDGQDRVRQITDPRSLVTSYTVDGLGNTTQQQSPDTGTTNATYDAVGNLTSRTDARGKTTTYSYDALNRPTRVAYASGTPTVLEYDGGTSPQPTDIGKLTRMTDESGSTRFQYNGFGNLLQKTQTTTANGVAKDQTIAYAYGTSGSSTGHAVSLAYPSGSVVGYSYDTGGRIAGLTLTTANGSVTLLSNIQYQPFGKPKSWTWGNGTAYVRSFDLSGRLTQFPLGATTGTGTTPNGLSRTVNYDAASRISAYTHTDTSGSTGSSTATAANQTFGYDDQNRLISYLPANSSQSYSYDANGNRTGQTIGGASYTQTIDPASNRQTASTGPAATTNSYDAAGNQTGDATTTYSYSDRGRLASVSKNGTTTSYLYNGLGQRVVKSGTNVPTGATRYVYDGAGHLIGEYDQSGNAIEETVYLDDTPVATVKNGTPYYIYADQIDTPRVITDTNNLMVWRWDQADPFGATLPDENPTSLGSFTYNLRFPGQVYDVETGKHYNANRDYDPAGGRYVQSDPIGLNGGQPSTYAYVDSNPISVIDPDGLKKIILLPPTDPNYPAAVNAADDPNLCIVISHGSNQTVNHMNAQQLNKRLAILGCKPKQPVKLDACRTGQGESSIAEQLARLRKATVIAPDNRTWTTPWNTNIDRPYPPVSDDHDSFWNTIPDWSKPGNWRTFGPAGPQP